MVNIKCMAREGAIIPEYKTAGAAGADLCALVDAPLTISAGKSAIVPTGLFLKFQRATKCRFVHVLDSLLKML